MSFHVPEKYRVRADAEMKGLSEFRVKATGNNGAFQFDVRHTVTRKVGGVELTQQLERVKLWCIASDGTDWEKTGYPLPAWEHVSISCRHLQRVPNWEEMCFVKHLFWDEEDTVIQFHPPRSEYVNHHPGVLHLWRPVGVELPRPPMVAVGPVPMASVVGA